MGWINGFSIAFGRERFREKNVVGGCLTGGNFFLQLANGVHILPNSFKSGGNYFAPYESLISQPEEGFHESSGSINQ
jgi:hypothetical protein